MNSLTATGPPSVPATSAQHVASTLPGPPAAPGSSADATTVTPVIPASHQVAPAAALDKVAGEPGVLQKAFGLAQPYIAKVDAVTHPYVEKVQQTTKPYTDAALTKAKELIDKVEGQAPPAGTTTAAAAQGGDGATTLGATANEHRGAGITGTSASAASSTTAVNPTASNVTLEDRLEGFIANVGRRASHVAAKIDEKTATTDKPGWASQVASAVQKVTDKADAYIQGHAPTSTNVTSTIGHPVATTTNTVPHTDKPITSASGTSTAPGAPLTAAAAPVAPIPSLQ